MSPDPSARAGGVERFCHLLSEALAPTRLEVRILGPPVVNRKWLERLGGRFLHHGKLAAEALEGIRPRLLVTNGFLGSHSSSFIPRIQVFHGSMAGLALRGDVGLPMRERVRR